MPLPSRQTYLERLDKIARTFQAAQLYRFPRRNFLIGAGETGACRNCRPGYYSVTISAATVEPALSIVAHEDDDLLFQNPDLLHDIQAGRRSRTSMSPQAMQAILPPTGKAGNPGKRQRMRRCAESPIPGRRPMPV